ncbi:hypothetical protein [Bacillus weihaiensis]|uniref:Uncharacterized protein n=1 Tax=Bacillus weihaiensis TaxID=1547283 RepID=A0A1L3MPV4_9BACI|nr:hypothetical protein [Bacillus weihaiensis]APH04380.1 hypothetical protein A9C19_06255 [Bacillus weihaiensis]
MKKNKVEEKATNSIRNGMCFYVDSIDLILYKTTIVVSWTISDQTAECFDMLLKESFQDLQMKLVLYASFDEFSSIYTSEYIIYDQSGTYQIHQLPNGVYSCEIKVVNSQNESITIKRSSETSVSNSYSLIDISSEKKWSLYNQGNNHDQNTFSGYTTYE